MLCKWFSRDIVDRCCYCALFKHQNVIKVHQISPSCVCVNFFQVKINSFVFESLPLTHLYRSLLKKACFYGKKILRTNRPFPIFQRNLSIILLTMQLTGPSYPFLRGHPVVPIVCSHGTVFPSNRPELSPSLEYNSRDLSISLMLNCSIWHRFLRFSHYILLCFYGKYK